MEPDCFPAEQKREPCAELTATPLLPSSTAVLIWALESWLCLYCLVSQWWCRGKCQHGEDKRSFSCLFCSEYFDGSFLFLLTLLLVDTSLCSPVIYELCSLESVLSNRTLPLHFLLVHSVCSVALTSSYSLAFVHTLLLSKIAIV